MDFQLTEDQKALRDGVRQFCEGRVGLDQLPELEKCGGFDRALWSDVAELGVFSLRIAEADGGVGLGAADAVLVFAELGRRLVPGPLVWSHLASDRVDGAALGDCVVGGVDCIGPLAEPVMIEHLEALDALVALRPDGVYRIDPRALDAEPVGLPADPLTPVHRVAALPDGERIAPAGEAARWRLDGAALAAAQMLGIAESTLELATDYAGKREQFGRPIGGFQAVKHILADMFVRQEVARAAVYAAGATIDDPVVGHVGRAVASAKINAGNAANRNARSCIQVHGGMGYTWEVPAHYFLKRTWVLETQFGAIEEHESAVADLLSQGL